MKVDRLEFLRLINYLSSGVASKEIIEQSTCIVFKNGQAFTYNDEVSVHAITPFDCDGTSIVPAKELLRVIDRLKPEEIDIEFTDGSMIISTPRTQVSIVSQKELNLPIDEINLEGDKKWVPVGGEFFQALEDCSCVTSKSTIRPFLFCVHVTSNYVESTDERQIIRVSCKTGIPKDREILIPSSAIRELKKFPYKGGSLCIDNSWCNIKIKETPTIFSCRLFASEYVDMKKFLESDISGQKVTIPESVIESLDHVMALQDESFSMERAQITFENKLITVYKQTMKGTITEKNRVKYDGEPFAIFVHPVLFKNLLTVDNTIYVTDRFIRSQVTEENGNEKTYIVYRYKQTNF
jgi:DNA polymerase III sliding clamp (beta) subunit (PCNA family)